MMIPSQTKPVRQPLFDEVKRLVALQNAWSHVRSSALGSSNSDTSRDLAHIERDSLSYLRSLQRDLGSGRFEFERQKGVLKQRKDKDPRPIIVAPLRNRIVQRAILNVCQSSRPPSLVRHLGRLPQALATPTSVGGLPGRGVTHALQLIRAAIADGATSYIRSDIHSFFADLPRAPLRAFLEREVTDKRFVELFEAGLDTDLANADDGDIRTWWSLFPTDSIGVPQGSALSAISANIVLHEFDACLNGRGIRTVRYLDDFLILGPSAHAVQKAWSKAEAVLAGLGLRAHQPGESSKAERGAVSDGFEFLSFRVKGTAVAPSSAAKRDLIEQVETVIRNTKRNLLAEMADARRAQARFAQSLTLLDRKIRGWGDAFRETSQRLEFRQLDQKLDQIIDGYIGWFLQVQAKQAVDVRRRMWGVALLADTPPAQGIS